MLISTKQVMTQVARSLRSILKPEGYVSRFHSQMKNHEGASGLGLALIKDAEKHDVLGKLSRYGASLVSSQCGGSYFKPTPFNPSFRFGHQR